MKQYREQANESELIRKLSEAQKEEATGTSKSLSNVMEKVRRKINERQK